MCDREAATSRGCHLGYTDTLTNLPDLSCNLGQNEIRNKTIPPSESMINWHLTQSAPFHHWTGEGVALIFRLLNCPRMCSKNSAE